MTVTVCLFMVAFWVTEDRNRRGGNSCRRIIKFNLQSFQTRMFVYKWTSKFLCFLMFFMFKWLVIHRWEEKRGEKKQQQKWEKVSYKDKAEGLWSVELKGCHVDDLVSGGGKHRTQNVWCLFWFSKETLVWVILAFCEAHENIHKHRVWSCADTHTLTFWMCVWILSMVGFCPQIWQFSPMCLHWSNIQISVGII